MKTKSQRSAAQERKLGVLTEIDDPKTKAIKDTLRVFFLMRDFRFVNHVDEICYHFDVPMISEGLLKKYKMIPIEWKEELDQNAKELDWYKAQKRRIKWLDQHLEDFPSINEYVRPSETSKLHKVIDEIIQKEKLYYKRLSFMGRTFAGELEAISQGKLGPEAQQTLGLDTRDIDFVFGTVFQHIVELSESLSTRLDIYEIFNRQTKSAGGRAGAIADIFIQHASAMENAFGPYSSRLPAITKLLDYREKEMLSRPKPRTKPREMPFLNYCEIWKEASFTKPMLKNKQIGTILQLPTKFTDYKLFFDRMLKSAKNSDCDEATVEKLEELGEVILMVYNNINAYVAEQENAENRILKGIIKR